MTDSSTKLVRDEWLFFKKHIIDCIDCAHDSKGKHDNAQYALSRFTRIGIGEYWTHYKGGVYQSVILAVKEDTLEPIMVYRSLKDGSIWVRTLDNWFEMVTLEDGTQVHRFKMGAP